MAQRLFGVVGFAPPQESRERRGAGPSTTAEKELGSPDRSGLHTVAIQYVSVPVWRSTTEILTQNHMRHRSAAAVSECGDVCQNEKLITAEI